jgi:hypothetical protein
MLLTYSTIRDKSLHEVIYLSRNPPKWTQLLDVPNWFVHFTWRAYYMLDMLVNCSLKTTMWVVPMFELVFAHFWVLIRSLRYLEGLVTIKFGSRTYKQSLPIIETQAWTKLLLLSPLPPPLFTKSKFFWYMSKYEFYKKETIKPYFFRQVFLVLIDCT